MRQESGTGGGGETDCFRPLAMSTKDLESAATRGGEEAFRVSARTDVGGGRYQSESWVRHEVTQKLRAETGVGRTLGEAMEKCLSCLEG